MTLSKSDKLKMCIGCYNNFYNGNNDLGVKECWMLKSARVVLKKKVGIWQVPPWKQAPIRILNCRREDGYIFVEKNVEQ